MKTVIDTLDGELPKEDISAFSFDRRTKDNRENGREGGGISLDDLSNVMTSFSGRNSVRRPRKARSCVR